MKKMIFSLAVLLAAAACAKQTPAEDLFNAPDDGVTTPEPIVFGSNVARVQTKAAGTVEAWNGEQELYVFGYERKAEMDYTKPYIKNVAASSPAEGTQGAITVLNPEHEGETFFYNSTSLYDFYACYGDDAIEHAMAQYSTTMVYFPFEITGAQDLMLAKADPEKDANEQVEAKYLYSGYAARRNAHPNLIFEHQLSRFNFKVVPMTAEALNMNITGITLNSFSTGNLVVAGEQRGILDPADEADLSLCSVVDGALVPITSENAVSLAGSAMSEPVNVGTCLMVVPAQDYTFKMSFTQTGATGFDHTEEHTLTPDLVEGSAATAFEAGNQYTVTVKVYGVQEIKISVELTPWGENQNIEIDEDKTPEL